MPRKIDRKTAATINGSADHKMKANKCYLHYTAKPISRHECEEDSTGKSESESKPESVGKVKCTEVQEETPGEQEVTDKEEIVDERETVTKPLCPIHDY